MFQSRIATPAGLHTGFSSGDSIRLLGIPPTAASSFKMRPLTLFSKLRLNLQIFKQRGTMHPASSSAESSPQRHVKFSLLSQQDSPQASQSPERQLNSFIIASACV